MLVKGASESCQILALVHLMVVGVVNLQSGYYNHDNPQCHWTMYTAWQCLLLIIMHLPVNNSQMLNIVGERNSNFHKFNSTSTCSNPEGPTHSYLNPSPHQLFISSSVEQRYQDVDYTHCSTSHVHSCSIWLCKALKAPLVSSN